MENMTAKVKINWRELRSIPIYLLLVYFIFIMSSYFKKNSIGKATGLSVLIIILLWSLLSFLYLIQIKALRTFMEKQRKWLNPLSLFLSPFIAFIMVEAMVSNLYMKMIKNFGIYNIVWYALIYFLIFAVSRNFRVSIIASSFLIYLASMVNYFVFLFRGNPILPSDLLAWKTGMSVASGYVPSFTKGYLIATLLLLMLFVLANKLAPAKTKPSVINRLVIGGIYFIFTAVVFFEFFHTDLIKSKIRVIDFFAPKYTYSAYGTAFGFVANINALRTESPEGYSVKKVEDVFKNIDEKKDVNGTKPNIIVIMNEAFSDLSLVGDYETNMDYLPYIRSLSENTIKGRLYVSVFGGATSDTEYEFLTGNSMAVMPPNCVPYQQFVTKKTDSLASTLKAQGYYNIAIHPYEKSGYKRDIVYPLLGFDEFLSKDDFENPKYIRSFISDEDSYKKIIEQYESKGDDPLFIFNVTMQNHGGYSGEKLFGEEDNVKLIDKPGYQSAEQYLSLLRKSDQAFKLLIDYFSKQQEPTIILIFGDHQPIAFSDFHNELQRNSSDMATLSKKYQVPFIMWANYDIEETYVDKISANYLSSYLLDIAGVKGSEYNQYLMKLHETLPVINGLFYIDKDDEYFRLGASSKYSDLINEYQCIGYNNALDKKNRLGQFYHLDK